MALLRLIRLPNLLIVALTQYLLYFQIILPPLRSQHIAPLMHPVQFFLLVLVTMLITAGGYIINDIADLRIDLINKPDRVIVGRRISHQVAYWLYFCINLTGFLISMYLAFATNHTALLFLFPAAVAGLLLYSARLKKRPLWGNLMVSFYCAGVAAIVWVAEAPALKQLPGSEATKVARLLIFYAAFAFFSTLFREIVKDIEDAQGDAYGKARTIPIAWGEKTAKLLAHLANIALLLCLGYSFFALRNDLNSWGLPFIGLVGILSGVSGYLLIKAKKKSQYHNISQFAKLMMLCGILILLFLK